MKLGEKIGYRIIYPPVYFLSLFPFFLLHRFSEFLYVVLYYLGRYRRKVVRENLVKSFPEKTLVEIVKIEKKFYLNFCDLIFETIKTFSISAENLNDRCTLLTPDTLTYLYDQRVNVTGISSHLCNWEWLALSLASHSEHICYGVYKPLSNRRLNHAVKGSRERTGIRMIAIQELREVFKMNHADPIMIGLLSDQAPHDYKKAFQVRFLNQDTFVVAGPGLITVQRNYTPIWGWMRRIGRSRYEWGVDLISVTPPIMWSADDLLQVDRIAKAFSIDLSQAGHALELTKQFTARLEEQIKKVPEDWLWSHRRWKTR